jgi:FlaA1/EpsC-like NDP-sugar epimerase
MPLLELDDGTLISESIAICRYFEAIHPQPPLFGTGAVEIAVVEMWNRRMELEILRPVGDAFEHLSPFWKGKRVLLTGHTGFKGSWLALWLAEMGARVTGLSLVPETEPSLFHLLNGKPVAAEICDLRDRHAVAARVMLSKPEIVLHLGAQALVRAG